MSVGRAGHLKIIRVRIFMAVWVEVEGTLLVDDLGER